MAFNKENESYIHSKSDEYYGQLDLMLNIGGETPSQLMMWLKNANVDIPQDVLDYIDSANITNIGKPVEVLLTSVMLKDLDVSGPGYVDELMTKPVPLSDFMLRAAEMGYSPCPVETPLKLALGIATGKLEKKLDEGNHAYNVVTDMFNLEKMLDLTGEVKPCYLGVWVRKTKGIENNGLGKSKVGLYLWEDDGNIFSDKTQFLFNGGVTDQ